MKRWMAKGILVVVSCMLFFPGCGDVVIKVNKKAKNSELKSVDGDKAMNLTVSDDFLHDLDSLKSQAASMINAV